MDKEDLFKETRQLINDFGGIAAVQRRATLSKIYLLLVGRSKRDVEHINFVKGLQVLDFSYTVDLYTDTGIAKLRIPKHSCIIYKEKIISDTIYRVNEFVKKHLNKYPEAKVFLIFQDKGELSSQIVKESKKQKLVEIYSVNEFLEKIKKVAKINDKIATFESDWKSKRESIISGAQFAFREDKCTFFLGAGVSMDAGGPSWDDVLRKIMRQNKKISTKRDFDKVNKWCRMSPIIMGRYAASNDYLVHSISEYLRKYVLYNGVNGDNSKWIDAICEVVEGQRDGQRIVMAGKVDSIITYNYDDLVETALERRGIPVARIYSKSRNTRNELPVYHVHGIIPQKAEGYISTPILGEKEYHQMYKESYHWSNVEQLHALDRNTCFFIGLSMTDPNLRRLLDISRNGSDNECRHYALLIREPLFPENEVEKNRRHFDTIEYQLSDLGVNVIWYEKHSEVPEIIRRIVAPIRYIG